jgi:hypothetical protein
LKQTRVLYDWSLKGKLHREDGPAYESKTSKEWYLHGKKISEEERYMK